jgi:hypothetical protein
MPDELEFVIDGLVFSILLADGHTMTVAEVERLIRRLISRAYQTYCAAGAPFGQSVVSFLIWLSSANRLTPSA